LLGAVNKLKFNIEMANQDIFWAKKNGTDVTEAQAHADAALKTVGTLAVLWHEFNLTHFEDQLDTANKEVKTAESIVRPTSVPTKSAAPKTSGFSSLLGMIAFLAMAYVFWNKR